MTPLRVLIVEDEPGARLLAERTIARAVPECELQSTGWLSEALAIVREWRPTLILLDLRLEDTFWDQFRTLPEMRAAAPMSAIVVITGWPEGMDVDTEREAAALLSKADDLQRTLPGGIASAVRRLRAREGEGALVEQIDPSLWNEEFLSEQRAALHALQDRIDAKRGGNGGE